MILSPLEIRAEEASVRQRKDENHPAFEALWVTAHSNISMDFYCDKLDETKERSLLNDVESIGSCSRRMGGDGRELSRLQTKPDLIWINSHVQISFPNALKRNTDLTKWKTPFVASRHQGDTIVES